MVLSVCEEAIVLEARRATMVVALGMGGVVCGRRWWCSWAGLRIESRSLRDARFW